MGHTQITGAISRILVLHAGALGDLVVTLPALARLRSGFPGARITAVGNLDFLGLFAAAGLFDEAVSISRAGFASLFGDSPLPEELKTFLGNFDLAVSWMRSEKLIARLGELGIRTAALDLPFPPPPGSIHASEYMTRPLAALGLTVTDTTPRLDLPGTIRRAGPDFRGIIIHPGSGSPKKNWPAPRFAEVAAALSRESGLPLAILTGPADAGPARILLDSLAAPAAHLSGLDIIELAGLLSRAAIVIGNDSGVSHLAAAIGTKTLSIHGPTDPKIWGIKGENTAIVSSPAPCSPCPMETMRACESRECLDAIDSEKAIAAAHQLLYK